RIQRLPSRSMAMRPSAGETCTARLVPSDSTTSGAALAETGASAAKTSARASAAVARPRPLLSGTADVQREQLVLVGLVADLHRLAADLAVLHVGLTAGREIQHDVHARRAERTPYPAFDHSRVHQGCRRRPDQ